MTNISLKDALQSLFAFALGKVRSSGEFAESVIVAMIDNNQGFGY